MDRTSWKPKIYKATEAVDYKANEEGTSDGAKKGWLTRQRGGSADKTDYSDKKDVYFKNDDGTVEKKSMSLDEFEKVRDDYKASGWSEAGSRPSDLQKEYEKQKESTTFDWAGQVGATKSETDQDKASDLMDKYYELVNEPMEDLPSDGSAMEERRSIHAKGIADFKAYLESSGSATVNQDVTDILEDENYHSLNKMLTKEEPTPEPEKQSSRDKEFYDQSTQNTLDTLNQSKVNGFPFFSYVGQPKQVISDGKGGIILYGMKRNPNSIRRVDVKYDEGRDTYSVSFMSNRNKPKGEYNDVYFDQLSGLIAGNKGLGVESKANEDDHKKSWDKLDSIAKQGFSDIGYDQKSWDSEPEEVRAEMETVVKDNLGENWKEVANKIYREELNKGKKSGGESKANELDLKNYTINPFDDVWVSECKQCGAEFTEFDYDNSENSVRNHLMSEHGIDDSHLGNTLYNQNEAKASESRIDELHGELVEGEFWDSGWQWKCDHCSGFKLGSSFGEDQIRLIEDHLKSSHGITEAKLKAGYVQCPHCSTQMSRLDWLQDHIKTSHPTKASESVLEKVNLNGWEFSVIDNGYGGGSFGSTPNHGLLEVGIFAPKSGSKTMAGDSEIKGWLTPEEVEDLKRTFEVDPVMAYRRIGGDWEEDWQKGLESKANEDDVPEDYWEYRDQGDPPDDWVNWYECKTCGKNRMDDGSDSMNTVDQHRRDNPTHRVEWTNATEESLAKESKLKANEEGVNDWWDRVTTDGSDLDRMWRGTHFNEIPIEHQNHYFSLYMEELSADKYGDHMAMHNATDFSHPAMYKDERGNYGGWQVEDSLHSGNTTNPFASQNDTISTLNDLSVNDDDPFGNSSVHRYGGESRKAELNKEINKLVKFIEIASVENPMHMSEYMQELEELKTERANLGESAYGHGSATGRMSPRDSWEQGYLADGTLGGGRMDPMFHDFRTMHWSELPSDIQEAWKAQGGYYSTGEGLVDNIEKQLNKFGLGYTLADRDPDQVEESTANEDSVFQKCPHCDDEFRYDVGDKEEEEIAERNLADHKRDYHMIRDTTNKWYESLTNEGFNQGLYGHVDAKCNTCGVEFDSIPDMNDHYAMHSDHISNLDDLDSDIPNSD